MAQNAAPGSENQNKGSSALDREAAHIDALNAPDHEKQEAKQGSRGLNNPTQIEQDNRVAKAAADAKAGGGGSDAPEAGLNQDG